MSAFASILTGPNVPTPTSLIQQIELLAEFTTSCEDKQLCPPNSFKRFSTIAGFPSPLKIENTFHAADFGVRQTMKTPYGDIDSYPISDRLRKNLLCQDFSLLQQCSLVLNECDPQIITVDTLASLPSVPFRTFIITAFRVYWIPMSHIGFHRDLDETQDIPSNLLRVFNFLCTPQIFERMFDECRDVLAFLFCWMQHTHFYGVDHSTRHVPSEPRDPDKRPLMKPHQLSEQLLRVLDQVLRSTGLSCSVDHIVTRILYGLKVSYFLSEVSEHVYAVRAARSTKCYLQLIRDDRVKLRLEYELHCIMLRSMNSYSMYMEQEDKDIFTSETDRLLRSMRSANLLISRQHPETSSSHHISPIKPSSTTESECSWGIVMGPAGDVVIPMRFGTSSRFHTECFRRGIVNCGFLYAQLAAYHYAMCSYEDAYRFSMCAIEQIRAYQDCGFLTSSHVVVEVLRILCKICVIKREYDLALKIIQCALSFSRHYLGTSNLTYAGLLLEYGCLLLNTDKTRKAAHVYAVAFAEIMNCLPGPSVLSALALEAMAYAHYVLEYTSGDFKYALKCARTAILILERLHHPDCMQAASANRVKALIIEEVAIDANDPRYFQEAEKLHLQSLHRCENTYGERNIQTAKHYGNLGRLYQSMELYKQAEENHKKAIAIKTDLLGESDFEVGLSLGHLASLYNYDMERFSDAAELHLKSIEISMNVFGPTYSGLEYDYRGLVRVYQHLDQPEDEAKFAERLEEWNIERDRMSRTSNNTEQVDELELKNDHPATAVMLWTDLSKLFDLYEEKFSKYFL